VSDPTSLLAQTQRRLWRLIAWPEGVAAGLAEEPRDEPPLETLVLGDARLAAISRLDVYANAYFSRIRDVLAESYPTLARALGDDGFHDLVTSYLAVHPSQHPSLRWIGARLPEFLAAHDGVESVRARWPFAPDLAALEWASEAAFDAPDAPVAARGDLARLPAEAWETLPLRLHPSTSLLSLAWPVHELRRAPREDPTLPKIALSPTWICVWRRSEQVVHRVVDAAEARALALAASRDDSEAGVVFGALCEQIASELGEEQAPAYAAAWLARWTDDGMIRAL
jgi:hypothetical protein